MIGRSRWRVGVVLPALALGAACGEADHPVPPEGRYEYAARYTAFAPEDTFSLRGVLILTETGPERVEGYWQVDQLHKELTDGAWTGAAYEVEATASYAGRLVHSLVPLEDGSLRCEGEYTLVTADGERTTPITCTLRPEAEFPISGETPPSVGSPPPIRPIDPDAEPPPVPR